MASDFYQAFSLIQQEGQTSSWRYLFNTSSLGKFFKQHHPQPFEFIEVYLASSWYLDYWFPNFMKRLGYPDFLQVVQAATYLNQRKLLHPQSFHAIVTHEQPIDVAWAIHYLTTLDCLNSERINLIALHPKPRDFVWGLSFLKKAKLLTPANQEQLFKFKNPHNLAWAMSYLEQAQILNQDNYSYLMQEEYQFLLSYPSLHLLWNHLPFDLLRRHWAAILVAARHDEPQPTLEALVTEILNQAPEHPQILNPRQSTHLTSIHRSVSKTAIQLKKLYANHIDIIAKIKDIKLFASQLDDKKLEHRAAKRAIARLCDPRYTYRDIHSSVSLLELLRYCFVAIHDESKRLGCFEDAKSAFITALYEIQRGYNLDETGQDNHLRDQPICSSGSFNKLIEKLKGCHSAFDITYVSPILAQMKLPKLAAQHTLRFLLEMADSGSAKDCYQVLVFLNTLEHDGSLELIWSRISPKVEQELWSEFHEAYAEKPDHPKFKALMQAGIYCLSPDLHQVKTNLRQSKGFQVWTDLQIDHALDIEKKMADLSEFSLWSNRHHSRHHQELFDQRFGLMKVI